MELSTFRQASEVYAEIRRHKSTKEDLEEDIKMVQKGSKEDIDTKIAFFKYIGGNRHKRVISIRLTGEEILKNLNRELYIVSNLLKKAERELSKL